MAALTDLFGMVVAAGSLVGWTRRIARATSATLAVIRQRLATARVVYFDETGLRVAGRLHWMHSASTSTDVLLTVHPRRGTKGGMDAAAVLPTFTGVAVRDAWAPYDTYTKVTHALCNAHAVRELVYVTDTAPAPVAALAGQAIDAMVAIKNLLEAAHTNGTAPDGAAIAAQQRLLRSAAVLDRSATAARASKLERKHHALLQRLITRWDDYQRCVNNPAVPWDNNAAEQTIRMPKLRTKVSGCLRPLTGAEQFAAIRSYIATAARHGQNMLDVLIQAANGHPWIPAT